MFGVFKTNRDAGLLRSKAVVLNVDSGFAALVPYF